MFDIPDKSCINCHFLCYPSNAGYNEISNELREKVKINHSIEVFANSNGGFPNVGCFQKVWLSGLKDIVDQKIYKDRTDFCYFFEYRPGMMPEGGVQLEKREQNNYKFYKQLRNNTITAWAALITAALSLIALVVNIFVHYHN